MSESQSVGIWSNSGNWGLWELHSSTTIWGTPNIMRKSPSYHVYFNGDLHKVLSNLILEIGNVYESMFIIIVTTDKKYTL